MRMAEIVAALNWTGPVFGIAAIDGDGTTALIQAAMARLEEIQQVVSDEEQMATDSKR